MDFSKRLSFGIKKGGGAYRKALSSLVSRAESLYINGVNHSDRQVVVVNRLEEANFRRQAERWPRFQNLADEGREKYPQFKDLLVDIYHALYMYQPTLRDPQTLAPTHRLNHQILRGVMSSDLWAQARSQSMHSVTQSMFGLVFIAQDLIDTMPEDLLERARQLEEQQKQQQQNHAQQLQQVTQLRQQLQAVEDPEEDEEGEIDEEMQEVLTQLSQALQQIEQEEEDLSQQGNNTQMPGDVLRRSVRRGMSSGVGQMAAMAQTMASWGEDFSSVQHLPIEERMALAERIRKLPKLSEFAEMVGRMKQIANDARLQPSAKQAEELANVTVGSRLQDVIPSERILMLEPDLEMLMLYKMSQEMLLINEYAGVQPAGKGPMIVLVDVSGSTMGSPEQWAKGFVLATLDMCKREERDAAIVYFDSDVHEDGIFLFPSGLGPAGVPTLVQKCAVAEYFTGGGTNFMAPLSVAIDQIEDAEGEWSQADIIMITDGVCGVEDEWLAQFKASCNAKSVRVHGIMLDVGAYYIDSLKSFCHQAWAVSSFQGATPSAPTFEQLLA